MNSDEKLRRGCIYLTTISDIIDHALKDPDSVYAKVELKQEVLKLFENYYDAVLELASGIKKEEKREDDRK